MEHQNDNENSETDENIEVLRQTVNESSAMRHYENATVGYGFKSSQVKKAWQRINAVKSYGGF